MSLPDGDDARRRVSLTLDPDADGRQHGTLSLALDGARTAHDRLVVPLVQLRRGEGPRVALIAGHDGDDAVGPLVLRRLAAEFDHERVAGTLRIVPFADPFVLAERLARAPRGVETTLDARFPGDANAPDPRSRLAASLLSHVLDDADLVLELRSGGEALAFPTTAAVRLGTPLARAEAAMIALGAPESVRLAHDVVPGTLARALGDDVAHVQLILDGTSAATETIEPAVTGCRNALVRHGALDAPFTLRATRVLELDDERGVVLAPAGGALEPRARLGQEVHRGDVLAALHDPERCGAPPCELRVPRDGVLLAARRDALVRAGECIALIADEVQR